MHTAMAVCSVAIRVARRGKRTSKLVQDLDMSRRSMYMSSLEGLVGDSIDPEVMSDIDELGLGRRKRALTARAATSHRSNACVSSLVGTVLSSRDPLPALPCDQLEVALVGRSNAGKSSLFNALTGEKGHRGRASVSAVPGWTSSMHFYELREHAYEKPLMTLVDLPGYGPAATKDTTRMGWLRAARRYLRDREQLACAFWAVDASLGLTIDDERFLDVLDGAAVEYHCILTKTDLLTPRELAQSYALIHRKVSHRVGYAGGDMPMCSSRNAAGIASLWHRMRLGVLHVHRQRPNNVVNAS